MKIKQLDVKGFKSLKEVSWQPGDLNVVIGQNGAGKSNLLRFLELIAASAQGRLSKHIQASGGMDAILWDGAVSSLCVGLQTNDPSYDYQLVLTRLGKTSSYQVERESLTGPKIPPPSTAKETSDQAVVQLLERSNGQAMHGNQPLHELVSISQEETLLSFNVIPSVFTSSALLFGGQLSHLAVYHDLDVGQNSKIRQAVVARSETQVESEGQNLVPVLHTLYTGNREFKRNIDSAMHAAFGDDYEELVFPPAADQRVQLRVRWKTLQREQSAADLSDGTLHFLLLLSVLAAPDPPMVIAIDEPETGLHPAMLPIIAEYAVEASSHSQIIFTTHSPQFLDAFQETVPTTTIVKWVDGETSLHVLGGEELDYWLRDYSIGTLFKSNELEAMV